ncbi:MAG: hypothetical protein JO347_03280, partial [Candidatus Eremiobacteraeota bacterium]|nr:hypothetical protein [Candidatus Eremiobacteraeota bacterium]
GDTLKDFAFALLVGVISGAYSSIFIASPLLVIWKNRDIAKRATERAAAAASEATATTASAADPARRLAPKPKRPTPPPPRYRRKRPAGDGQSEAFDDGGVLTETADGDATGEASPSDQS